MALENEKENDQFRLFLHQEGTVDLDEIVHRLNITVSAVIDCRQCGNCCRSLMINVLPQEAEQLASFLHLSAIAFKEIYVEESEQGQLVINTIPCHFLDDNKCRIYDHRFLECREFPHLHKPGFTSRLFGTLMHYGRCPIVFNVIELLKKELSFNKENIRTSPMQ